MLGSCSTLPRRKKRRRRRKAVYRIQVELSNPFGMYTTTDISTHPTAVTNSNLDGISSHEAYL